VPRAAILVALAVLMAGAAVWLLIVPEPGRVGRSPATPSIGLRHAAITVRQRGQKQAEIAADRVEVSADGHTTTFAGSPRARVFVGGQSALVLTADRVEYDRATSDVRVEGGIRITTSRGEVITAPRALWKQSTGVLELIDGVEVRFPLEGRRLP
jgi:lipopolysaccharide assembly outer membrane protein LptD (OstA)